MSIKSSLVCNKCGAEEPSDSSNAVAWLIVTCRSAFGVEIGKAMHLCGAKCVPEFAKTYPNSMVDKFVEGATRIASHETSIPISTDVRVQKNGDPVWATVRPQFEWFDPVGLAIDGNPADWVIADWKIGNCSQFSQAGNVPGDSFHAANMPPISFDRATPATDISIIVRYIGPNPDGEVFSAKLIGVASGSEGEPRRPASVAMPAAVMKTAHPFSALSAPVQSIATTMLQWLGKHEREAAYSPWSAAMRGFAIELVYIPPDEKWIPLGVGVDFKAAQTSIELAYNVAKLAASHARELVAVKEDVVKISMDKVGSRTVAKQTGPDADPAKIASLYPARYVLRIKSALTLREQFTHAFQIERLV